MKPLFARMLRHAFLSGFVAARNIPGDQTCDGSTAWTEYNPHPKDLERLKRWEATGPVGIRTLEPAPCAVGDKIRLESMGLDQNGKADPDPIPSGTTGTVIGLCPIRSDSTWQISVAWDVKRSLSLIWPIDSLSFLSKADSATTDMETTQ